MKNHPGRPFPSVQGLSWEGYTYTLSPNTRADGSAVNWFWIKGFWCNDPPETTASIPARKKPEIDFRIKVLFKYYGFRKGSQKVLEMHLTFCFPSHKFSV